VPIDDPRVPAETVVVSMDLGMSATEVREIFGPKTRLEDLEAIYKYVKDQHVAHPV
jgi:uncharacterized protein (DUF433 family)